MPRNAYCRAIVIYSNNFNINLTATYYDRFPPALSIYARGPYKPFLHSIEEMADARASFVNASESAPGGLPKSSLPSQYLVHIYNLNCKRSLIKHCEIKRYWRNIPAHAH